MEKVYDRQAANWISLIKPIIIWVCKHESKAFVSSLFPKIYRAYSVARNHLLSTSVSNIKAYNSSLSFNGGITLKAIVKGYESKKDKNTFCTRVRFTVLYRNEKGEDIIIPWAFLKQFVHENYFVNDKLVTEKEYLRLKIKKKL